MKFLTCFLVGVRHTIGSGIAYLEYNVSIDNILTFVPVAIAAAAASIFTKRYQTFQIPQNKDGSQSQKDDNPCERR